MLKQYYAPRGKPMANRAPSALVGPVRAGEYLRINGMLCRVEGWHPREYSQRGPDGRFRSVRIRGGHLATVCRIRDAKRFRIAEQFLYH